MRRLVWSPLVVCFIAACADDPTPGSTNTTRDDAEDTGSETTTESDTSTSTTTSDDTSSTGDTGTDSATSDSGTDTGAGDDTTETTGGDASVTVDCAMPPAGAVGADYAHTFVASGGSGSYVWSATDLPAGLALNPLTGALAGQPTEEGNFAATITATSGIDDVGTAECDIEIAPAVDVDLSGLDRPCVDASVDLEALVTGGDGSPLSCTVLTGAGNGKLPAGVTVDPASCAIEGDITSSRYGTWVWMTRVQQSGAGVIVPFCATNDTPAAGAYEVVVEHGNLTDGALIPGTGAFMDGMPLAYGGVGDPKFRVLEACGNVNCFYGYAMTYNGSGFDDVSLGTFGDEDDGSGDFAGFSHELLLSGDADARFDGRPWVINVALDYCVAMDNATCATTEDVLANGNGNLEFAVIMNPAP